jgi:hypothetical protein
VQPISDWTKRGGIRIIRWRCRLEKRSVLVDDGNTVKLQQCCSAVFAARAFTNTNDSKVNQCWNSTIRAMDAA